MRPAVMRDDEVFDVSQVLGREVASLRSLLAEGVSVRGELRDKVAVFGGPPLGIQADISFAPPIPDPGKIVCVGLNYRSHAAEAGLELPLHPEIFAKYPNSLAAHGDPIRLPNESEFVDYEAELAVVVGAEARGVGPRQALSLIAGVMPFNDVSGRTTQTRGLQWTLGKSFDSFAPCGPLIVSLDELPPDLDLEITLELNGEVKQRGRTGDLVFGIAELVSQLSEVMTLWPGDIIATGTPSGIGFMLDPPVRLSPGDTVAVEVERVGRLVNPVV